MGALDRDRERERNRRERETAKERKGERQLSLLENVTSSTFRYSEVFFQSLSSTGPAEVFILHSEQRQKKTNCAAAQPSVQLVTMVTDNNVTPTANHHLWSTTVEMKAAGKMGQRGFTRQHPRPPPTHRGMCTHTHAHTPIERERTAVPAEEKI